MSTGLTGESKALAFNVCTGRAQNTLQLHIRLCLCFGLELAESHMARCF